MLVNIICILVIVLMVYQLISDIFHKKNLHKKLAKIKADLASLDDDAMYVLSGRAMTNLLREASEKGVARDTVRFCNKDYNISIVEYTGIPS